MRIREPEGYHNAKIAQCAGRTAPEKIRPALCAPVAIYEAIQECRFLLLRVLVMMCLCEQSEQR